MSIVTDKSNFGNFYRPILAWLVALLFFFPIFWMIFTSFKTDADAVKDMQKFQTVFNFIEESLSKKNKNTDISKEIVLGSQEDEKTLILIYL